MSKKEVTSGNLRDDVDGRPILSSVPETKYIPCLSVIQELERHHIDVESFLTYTDGWGHKEKSQFIEAVINNFPTGMMLMGDSNQRVCYDGKQRLSALLEFYQGKFKILSSNYPEYLHLDSSSYAGKYFQELPEKYKRTFERYSIAIVLLPADLKPWILVEIVKRWKTGRSPLGSKASNFQKTRERVLTAFAEMEQSHILAKANLADCTSCAIAELEEMLRNEPKYVGAVYWHNQDDERFWDTGILRLGVVFNNYESAHAIFQTAITALRSSGLDVEWPGNLDVKIEVTAQHSDTEE